MIVYIFCLVIVKFTKKEEVLLLRMGNTENARLLMEKMLHNSVEMLNALC